jgi:hypothetical protein
MQDTTTVTIHENKRKFQLANMLCLLDGQSRPSKLVSRISGVAVTCIAELGRDEPIRGFTRELDIEL